MQSVDAAPGLGVGPREVDVVRALRRSARRLDAEARELADLADRAANGLPRAHRALRGAAPPG